MLPLMSLAQYQYLGTYNNQGVPDYLEGRDEIAPGLLADIAASLPEGKPVPTYNPHYISSGYDTDIHLIDSAEVYVTFVGEGAGYKNVLGFYTYNLDNPYTSAPPSNEITIIFPNVSAAGSGGGLIAGDRVKLGNFPPNTGIGWVLMANGWKGSRTGVTKGNWVLFSNPDFNPEANESDRFHNVLLKNNEEELIVLGFEDIRRDYASCDQDFNDALFYVTANPFTAIASENFVELTDSETVASSANDGGLESDGSMASLIAKRNHARSKKRRLANRKKFQVSLPESKARTENSMARYLPETGFSGSESAFQSSPVDLIDLTNAVEVFSVDYYQEESRVAASLAIRSENSVYNHSKNICDRFNGSKINDIRYAWLGDHQIMFASIERATGETEFASWFSIQEDKSRLFSLWNLEEYPPGDYLNFQVWGSSPAQLFHQVYHILEELKSEGSLHQDLNVHRLPATFASSGYYEGGHLTLNIVNRQHDSKLILSGQYRPTESSEMVDVSYELDLTGDLEQTVQIETGQLFDFGFSINSPSSVTPDALYLADGAWGVDYEDADISSMEITNNQSSFGSELLIERNINISGVNDQVVNVFRHLSFKQKSQSYLGYSSLFLEVANSNPIELIILGRGMKWEDRLVTTIPVNSSLREIQISLEDFKTVDGVGAVIPVGIESIVFSHLNQYGDSERFNTTIQNLRFSKERVVLSANSFDVEETFNMYPNPTRNKITLLLPNNGITLVEIIDLRGKLILSSVLDANNNEIQLQINSVPGIYNVIVTQNSTTMVKKLVIE